MNILTAQVYINVFYSIILVCASIGGWFAFKRGRRVDAASMQNDAIVALQAQLNSLKDELHDLKDENTRLRQTIETIKLALLRKGWHVTIDGETIIVSDKRGNDALTPLRPNKPRPKAAKGEDTTNA